ncbi:hypothetical protein SLE2022_072180 [Rubroshorea leprosula]
MKLAMAVLPLLFLTVLSHSEADQAFDVRQHLSTVSRYGAVKDIADNSFVPTGIPDGCTRIHLNLVARHGTRSPTKKRIRELDRLAARKLTGGELISKGEDELYDLGIRIRERFPDLFNEEYHPDVYTIKATHVPRTFASAVAFGMGLFRERGSLGPGRHRAFAVISESCACDIMLRFFDCCENYEDFSKNQKPAVEKLKGPIFDEIASALQKRYELNFRSRDISSLWFLCKQEASLLDTTDQACGLFSHSEVALLEWTDDVEFFILKGYGNSLNYQMGVPLLKDILRSMEQAIKAKEENQAPGSYEKARLRFAHAETVAPISCLLGLFLEGSEFEQIQKEEPLDLPPKPPQKRNWRGSTVAPFGGNNMLVLYSCPVNSSSKYFVQVLHNEHPIPMPGCNGADFCPFEVFKERVVVPQTKHDYHALCKAKLEQPVQKPATKEKKAYCLHFVCCNSHLV